MSDDVRIEDLYRLILEFRGDLREAVVKMEERHNFYTEKLAKHEADIDENFKRTRALENTLSKHTVIVGGISGLSGAVAASLMIKLFLGG